MSVKTDGQEATSVSTYAVVQNRPQHRLHINYLDGIRGLAALYVVVHHCMVYSFWQQDHYTPSRVMHFVQTCLAMGHQSVVTFIVLSGYCLMLPVASSSEAWFSGGVGRYLKRRSLRILPPYYAALAFSLLLIACLPTRAILQSSDTTIHWKSWLPAFTPGVLLSHLFLVHNLLPQWWDKIDGPTWTVATEWQLYFTLPLLVLLWKRWGALLMALVGTVAGIGIHYLAPPLDNACLWFLACFTFGVVAAIVSCRDRQGGSKVSWRKLTVVGYILAAICGVILIRGVHIISSRLWFLDPLVGLTVAIWLVLLTHACNGSAAQEADPSGQPSRPWLVRFLEAPVCARLGKISYSLYLIHGPILITVQWLTRCAHLSVPASFSVLLLVGAPLALVAATLFHAAIEAPSLRLRA